MPPSYCTQFSEKNQNPQETREAEKTVKTENPAQLAELFAAHNITLAEGLTIEKAFELVKAQENAELDEEALSVVNGGIALSLAVSSAVVLAVAATELCFFAGYAYQTYKNAKKKKK